MSDGASKRVVFVAQHEPALSAGLYEIKATLKAEQADSNDNTSVAIAKFSVAGPRFHIEPSDIHSMFPPPASLGDHANVLPHIVLRRSTLPWERRAGKDTPWLALLVFYDGEILEAGVKTISELGLNAGESSDEKFSYIKVGSDVLKRLLPSADDLKQLTHVRRTGDGRELAVVVGNRLPHNGAASTAHLVSMEGRYGDSGFQFPAVDVTLISLATWRFQCDPAGGRFPDQLKALEAGPLGTHVTLRHRQRDGKRAISWYRGPLSPTPADHPLSFDVKRADDLVGKFQGVRDVSYAAAWELGRLLTLRNKHVAAQLFLWKRRHVHSRQTVKRRIQHQGTGYAGLPPDIPAPVLDWFHALGQLEHVPFHYLVPDESLLPKDSLRFFQVDRAWLQCLQAGAFSVGHGSSSLYLPSRPAPAEKQLCGFLLRSAAVTHWPHLIIEASSEHLAKENQDQELPSTLLLVRPEVISPGILLCLFEGDGIRTLDFHQKPEALHYGFDPSNDKDVYTKRPRDKTGKNVDVGSVQPRIINGRLDAAGYATDLKTPLGYTDFTSAEFALAMIAGVDRVRFIAE